MEFSGTAAVIFDKSEVGHANEIISAIDKRVSAAGSVSSEPFIKLGRGAKSIEIDPDGTRAIAKMASFAIRHHLEVSFDSHLFAIKFLNQYYRAIRPHLYQY